jgi:hypothetical protein
MTTTFRVVLAGLLLVAALVAPPAILANVVAGAGGLALLGSISAPVAVSSMPGTMPPFVSGCRAGQRAPGCRVERPGRRGCIQDGRRKINQPFLSHRGLKYFAFAK